MYNSLMSQLSGFGVSCFVLIQTVAFDYGLFSSHVFLSANEILSADAKCLILHFVW
jgi:hypothetical protein